MKYQYSHRCALRQPAVNEPRSTTRETPRHISPPPPWRKTASRESVWARCSRSSRVSRPRRRSPRGRSRFKRSALSCCPVDYLRYSSVPACRPRRPADISLLRRGPYNCALSSASSFLPAPAPLHNAGACRPAAAAAAASFLVNHGLRRIIINAWPRRPSVAAARRLAEAGLRRIIDGWRRRGRLQHRRGSRGRSSESYRGHPPDRRWLADGPRHGRGGRPRTPRRRDRGRGSTFRHGPRPPKGRGGTAAGPGGASHAEGWNPWSFHAIYPPAPSCLSQPPAQRRRLPPCRRRCRRQPPG